MRRTSVLFRFAKTTEKSWSDVGKVDELQATSARRPRLTVLCRELSGLPKRFNLLSRLARLPPSADRQLKA